MLMSSDKEFSVFQVRYVCMLLFLILASYTKAGYVRAEPLPKPWSQHNLYDYETGMTNSDVFEGRFSAYMKSRNHELIDRGGGIIQAIWVPYDWLGNKIRMTAYVRTIGVRKAAALCMKITTDYGDILLSDIISITGDTDWTRHRISMYVPRIASEIEFGICLLGKGEVRVDKFGFEKLASDMETMEEKISKKKYDMPRDLDFESVSGFKPVVGRCPLPLPWTQQNLYEYETGITTSAPYEGFASAYLKSRDAVGNITYGFLEQKISVPEEWLGKRFRLTAWLGTSGVEKGAGLFMDISTPDGALTDYMRDRYVSGDTDWKCCQIVSDIPYDASQIQFGAWLQGKGEVRADSFRFEIADDESITTKFVRKEYGMPGNLDFEQTERGAKD